MMLARLRNKRVRRGQTVTVTITKPGYVGRVITRIVKRYGHTRAAVERAARRPFTETVRCIPAGATKPAKNARSGSQRRARRGGGAGRLGAYRG
jgi:hypothetical protein